MEAISTPAVSTVAPADIERAVAVIVLAFSADPVARWAYPNSRQYVALFPDLVRAFGGRAFTRGTARHINAFAGAALWLTPGIDPDHAALQASYREGGKPSWPPSLKRWLATIRARPTGTCR